MSRETRGTGWNNDDVKDTLPRDARANPEVRSWVPVLCPPAAIYTLVSLFIPRAMKNREKAIGKWSSDGMLPKKHPEDTGDTGDGGKWTLGHGHLLSPVRRHLRRGHTCSLMQKTTSRKPRKGDPSTGNLKNKRPGLAGIPHPPFTGHSIHKHRQNQVAHEDTGNMA